MMSLGGMFSSRLAWRLDMKAYSMDLRLRALRLLEVVIKFGFLGHI